jgi:7,8-dihydropterin-6-yl-methyl-4-(beta-D-ribofuranosyl)aminobenzene 5'-phosphate synthase
VQSTVLGVKLRTRKRDGFHFPLSGSLDFSDDARPELPAKMRYFRGATRPDAKSWVAWTDTNMTAVSEPMTIAPHIRLVSLVSEKPAFKGRREISLVLDTPTGPVVFVGCSHPGIEGILASATTADPAKQVSMLGGGNAGCTCGEVSRQDDEYRACSGELAFLRVQQRWKDRSIYAGLGETIVF